MASASPIPEPTVRSGPAWPDERDISADHTCSELHRAADESEDQTEHLHERFHGQISHFFMRVASGMWGAQILNPYHLHGPAFGECPYVACIVPLEPIFQFKGVPTKREILLKMVKPVASVENDMRLGLLEPAL